MEKETKKEEVKQEKKRLSPDSTVLLTIGAIAGIMVLVGIVGLIFRVF